MFASSGTRCRSYVVQLFLVVTLPAVFGQSVAAPIMNGKFETGDFSSWTYGSGYVFATVVDNQYPLAPLQGDHSALLVARGNQNIYPPPYDLGWHSCAGDQWNINCPNPTPFMNASAGGPPLTHRDPSLRCGACIGQDFDAIAGDIVSVDWQFLTNDSGFTDDAVVEFSNGTTNLVTRFSNQGNVGSTIREAPDGTGFRYATARVSLFTYLPSSGVWTMYVGAYQNWDDYVSSGLLVDNIRQFREIPEPSALQLTVSSLLGLYIVVRRQKQSRGHAFRRCPRTKAIVETTYEDSTNS